MKCHKIPSSKSQADHADKWTDGQMDKHDEANSYILQFCEHVYKTACM